MYDLCTVAHTKSHRFLPRIEILSRKTQSAIPLENASIVTKIDHGTSPYLIQPSFIRAAKYLFYPPTDDAVIVQQIKEPFDTVSEFYLNHRSQVSATKFSITADDSFLFPFRIANIQREAAFYIGYYSAENIQ